MLRLAGRLLCGWTICVALVLRAGANEPLQSGPQIVFTSAGKTGLIAADGGGLRWLELDVPGQATWQCAGAFSDGRMLLLSMEPRRDGPGRPFDEYYTQTPTHIWAYDPQSGALEELATHERQAPFYTPALLVGDDRMLVQVVKDRVGQIVSMNLDGTDARPFTAAGEGLPYGLSLSPSGRRVAFHLASPQGYQVWTSDLDGENRTLVAADPEHLYFGTSWSPDGQWILFQDCHYRSDPGHDWSDICVGRADGTEGRNLTTGQAQWFAATYGDAQHRGSGSNMPTWTADGKILYSRRLPDSQPAWEYQPQRPDTDHFNRDFKPAAARGGTEVHRLDPVTGASTPLTHTTGGRWDFRPNSAPDGSAIVFCRAATGEVAELWIMGPDGQDPRRLAVGLDGHSADHPRWLPASALNASP